MKHQTFKSLKNKKMKKNQQKPKTTDRKICEGEMKTCLKIGKYLRNPKKQT